MIVTVQAPTPHVDLGTAVMMNGRKIGEVTATVFNPNTATSCISLSIRVDDPEARAAILNGRPGDLTCSFFVPRVECHAVQP